MKNYGKVYYTGRVASGYYMKNNWEDDEFKEMARQLILEDCSNKYDKELCGRNYNSIKDYTDALGAGYYNSRNYNQGNYNPRNYNPRNYNSRNYNPRNYNPINYNPRNYPINNPGYTYDQLAELLEVNDGKKRKSSKRKSSKRKSSKRKLSKKKSSKRKM
uniref:Uncharacterized protein n=1 Tax=viral metagenome TaxID=1070528 RepID=A0A6C0E1D9_9ZZZZ